jgi:hypothetical protein
MPAGVICRKARICRKVRARIEWTVGTCRRSTVTRAARWAGCGRSRPVAWSMHTAAGPVRRICRQRPSGQRSYRRSRTRCCGTPSAMRWGKAPVPCGFPLLVARSARRPVRLSKTGGDAFLEPYGGEGPCLGLCDDVVTVQAWCWAVAGWVLWSPGAGLGSGCLAGWGPYANPAIAPSAANAAAASRTSLSPRAVPARAA